MIRAAIVTVSMCAVILSWSVPAMAQDGPEAQVASDPRVLDAVNAWTVWVEYQLAINNVPGASVAVVHDQAVLMAKGLGLANPATGRAVTPDTIYSICSNSKLFTSIGVMQLRDAGRLRLDDELSDHLEWFAIEDAHPDDEPITIRRILTHSSGLPRESDYPYWTDPSFPFPTHDEIVDRIDDQATLYPSGRYYQYSNLGLTLAGEIVVAASGRPFDEYISAQILDPLGMADTFTEIPAAHHGERMAIGHSARKLDGTRDPLPLFQTRGIAPAAGFASTVEDLARFASWQLRLRGNGGGEVLRAATLREMHRVHWVDPDWDTTWGLGFVVRQLDDYTLIEHGGACPGYYSQVTVEPKSELGVIILSNAIGTEVDHYVEKAIELIAPAVEEAKGDPDGAPEHDSNLDRYAGIYDSIWGQEAVVMWGDGLAMISLRTRNPKDNLEKLQKVGDHTFRRIRDDDESLGETVIFDVGDDGTATRFKQHSNWYVRVK
jgi:CubicO group peptidase (beta-lactamase class C family)